MIFNKNFIVIILFSFIIFACSKDEIQDPEEEQEVVDPPEEPVVVDKTNNRLTMGSWGSQLLTASEFKSMHIEIGYVEGYKPEDEALDMLKDFLEKRIHKPEGIEFSLKSLSSSNKAPFDRDDWESIEDENREIYNSGDKLAVWIYFADGGKDDGNGSTTGALGTAYKNTSIIIYDKKIDEVFDGSDIQNSLVQANMMAHEFGHLFGLVNGGITPVSEHSNPDSPTHCITQSCLMATNKTYPANQQEMWELDDSCISDLRSIGGK